ncbi:uncharacterized protein [Anoplolepis gracilipes]|uniref:uncharacterized protein isoform X1 n=1 Tax=Anoplolepis gracilipes TaxID=354296 RepID=UPI003BA3BD58
MATITDVSTEVREKILSCENIDLEDIKNFKSTCEILRHINPRNQIWQEKFYQRCYTARIKYMGKETEKQKEKFAKLNFEKQITKGIKSIRKLQYYLHLMSENKLCDITKKKLECLLHFIAENSMIYYFVYDELNRIISAKLPWSRPTLTTNSKYNLILNCLKQYRFVYKINKFMDIPREKQILEILFTILAQYFKPHISYSVIKTWLNDITQEFLSRLKQKYPAHSIFLTSFEQLSFWKDNNIYDHFWNTVETKQIMDELRAFIYYLRENFYDLLERLDTNLKFREVLKNAHYDIKHISVLSMCHCIARRLGVRCALVPYKSRFEPIAIVWKLKYRAEKNMTELFHVRDDSYQLYPYAGQNYHYKELSNIEVIQIMVNHPLMASRNFNKLWEMNLVNLHEIMLYRRRNIHAQYSRITNTVQVKIKQSEAEKLEIAGKLIIIGIILGLCMIIVYIFNIKQIVLGS